MNVFEIRNHLISDYEQYVSSFINIRSLQIREKVNAEMGSGLMFPDPLIQLNPSFERGKRIEELAEEGVLHDECRNIFRVDKDEKSNGKELRLHRHQEEAVRIARGGHSYVLTTGTGSGKSLGYIVPIVDFVLRNGSGKGIKAIIVYPMNALANSQYGELEKFLVHGYPKNQPPVRFERYTGQEGHEKRDEIIADPPDIILTNYVMLELLLTRVHEKKLIDAATGLRFLVFDELHTYRGRQGADISMLIRRVRDRLETEKLQCVGTSATIAGQGTYAEQQAEVAKVASQIFGTEIAPEHVVGETLRPATADRDIADSTFIEDLKGRVSDPKYTPSKKYEEFISDPVSIWLEATFGLRVELESGRLLRAKPISITGKNGAAKRLYELTGVDEDRCAEVIQKGLLGGYTCEPDPETGFHVFAFRLHQFVSKGDTVYSTLDPESERFVTLNGQQYKPSDRERVLLPMGFCRECGQEYYSVRKSIQQKVYSSRELSDQSKDDASIAGFLYRSEENPWSDELSEILQNIPEDWVENHQGSPRVKRSMRHLIPSRVKVNTLGEEVDDGLDFHFFPSPFRFCLNCGVAYSGRQRNDFSKLSTLSSEGRSTATTILSLSAIQILKAQEDLKPKARKLLSFTDNRQDASLQAGHFNDFIEIGILRSAIHKAVAEAGEEGLRHDVLTKRVFESLDLPLHHYAQNPEAKYGDLEDTQAALRAVLGYRIYNDLKRGWRITAPNLEQVGLLKIKYRSLGEICKDESLWSGKHPALTSATPETREKVSTVLLDHMRRELAIHVEYLNKTDQERIKQKSNQHLISPWEIDPNEVLQYASVVYPRSKRTREEDGSDVFLSGRSGVGQYLRRTSTFPAFDQKLDVAETETILVDLLDALCATPVKKVRDSNPDVSGDVAGYQLAASSMIWVAGDGTEPLYDPIRMPSKGDEESKVNQFFLNYYKDVAPKTLGFEAREHTAQVNSEDRESREKKFRAGELPILFCSPTMELGVDISELNAVNMRNVPPTPANYAQRSGRAGRSGQPALVFSYCTTGSPHDQYYFRHPEMMVYGAVTPPRLEIANEDLVRAHVQAIWLSEADLDLGSSLRDLLDLDGDDPSLEILESKQADIDNQKARNRAKVKAQKILDTIKPYLEDSDWYTPKWLDEQIDHIGFHFDRACDRWRELFRSARSQAREQGKIVIDVTRTSAEKETAKRLRREAEAQLDLLLDTSVISQSDFYSYRYFASEGFLPGYSFPRLPISAFIPAQRVKSNDHYISRPRFLAVTEFAPRSIIYHEGSRYIINKAILPIGDDLTTRKAKVCSSCGYLHPIDGEGGADVCDRCGVDLPDAMQMLFRMQNVSTKRRERINCDEEERMRMGYDILTSVRFSEEDGFPKYRTAEVTVDGEPFMHLSYGSTATIWRINKGWKRRKDENQLGFVIDLERGYWASEKENDQDPEDPMSQRTGRVIPYVDDRKNALLIEPAETLDESVMASLQSALKIGIQVRYQLEDSELASESLPERGERKIMLLYESAEGGAGVLRRVIDDPDALSEIAREALEICHFDPDTGEDRRRAERSTEDCEAACYDCLMSYYNQPEHKMLDRHQIKDHLLKLKTAHVKCSPAPVPRAQHLENLKKQCDSGLEKQWLDFLEKRNLRLPNRAQPYIEECKTRPDFLYEVNGHIAIYIDGSPHDFPDRQKRDEQQTNCMEDRGYMVLRFHHADNWDEIVDTYPSIFGLKA
jgi:ATP-dependent helicase YprA (DUF1998 family)/very-short-patch-repair endonuclease